MNRFHASSIFSACQVTATWEVQNKTNSQSIDRALAERQVKAAAHYAEAMSGLGLSASRASMKKISDKFADESTAWKDISQLAGEFLGRLIDETEDRMFFYLSSRETECFAMPRAGWESAVARFPSIVDDVEEAQKCFALSRYAAAVFHSVQIIEAGLIELGGFLKISDPHSGWTSVAGALQKVIDKKHTDRSRFERKNFTFLEQMQGLVQGLKNAWRNKISHVHGRLTLISKEFSPEVAEEILIASRAFMRRLAEELPPPKAKKGAKK